MAAIISGLDFSVSGDKRSTIATVTGDTSYPTGGYSIAPNQIGLGTVLFADASFLANSTPAVRAAVYNTSTNKLLLFGENFSEVANGTDVSAFSGKIQAFGW